MCPQWVASIVIMLILPHGKHVLMCLWIAMWLNIPLIIRMNKPQYTRLLALKVITFKMLFMTMSYSWIICKNSTRNFSFSVFCSGCSMCLQTLSKVMEYENGASAIRWIIFRIRVDGGTYFLLCSVYVSYRKSVIDNKRDTSADL